jgi:hypothetical protein
MPDKDDLVILVVVVLAAIALLVGPLASVGIRSNMYTIKVNHCDQTLYENTTKWFTGDWSVVPGIGVCPNGRLTYRKTRHKNDEGKYSSAAKRYHDCINFERDKSDWKHIDSGNQATGYDSDLEGGAKSWYKAKQCYLSGIVFAFIILGLGGAGTSDSDELVVSIGTLMIIPLSFILFVVAFVLTANTDQLNEKAWSNYYFQSCDVNIVPDIGYRYLMTATVLSGLITLVMILFLFFTAVSLWDCKNCTTRQTIQTPESDAHIEAETVEAEAEITTVNIPTTYVQVVRQAIKDTRIQFVRQLSDNSVRLSSRSASDSACGNNSLETIYAHQVDINADADATAQPVAEAETVPPDLRHL